jgi:hypothetical protein
MELVFGSAGYAAIVIYVVTVLLYFVTIFFAPSSWYVGPAYFWRSEKIRIASRAEPTAATSASVNAIPRDASSSRTIEKDGGGVCYVMPPTTNRFAYMTLRTAPINAIQQLRGILEIARNMAVFCTSIFGFLRYMDTSDRVSHSGITGLCGLIMQFDCFIAIMCIVQASRLIYHLDFLVMVLPRRDRTQDELAAEAIGLAVGIADHTENELMRQKEARFHNTAVIVEAVSLLNASNIQDSQQAPPSCEIQPEQQCATASAPRRERERGVSICQGQWSHASRVIDYVSERTSSKPQKSAVVSIEPQGSPAILSGRPAELPPLATIAGHDVTRILREAEAELLRRSRRLSLDAPQADELGRALSPKASPKATKLIWSRRDKSTAIAGGPSPDSQSTASLVSSRSSSVSSAPVADKKSPRKGTLRISKSEGDFPSFDAPSGNDGNAQLPDDPQTVVENAGVAPSSSLSATVTPTSSTVAVPKPMRQSSSVSSLQASATGTRRRAFTVRGVTPTLDRHTTVDDDAETRSSRSHKSTSGIIIRKKKKLGRLIRSFLGPKEDEPSTERPPSQIAACCDENRSDVHHHHRHQSNRHFPFGVDLSHIDKSGIAIANILSKPNQNTESILSRIAADRGFDSYHNSTDDSASVASSFPNQQDHKSFAVSNEHATAAAYATQLMAHLALEEQLSYEQHEQRLATLTKMTSGNLVIALRLMVFLFPPLMGMFHEGAMIGGTAASLAVAVYMDMSIV